MNIEDIISNPNKLNETFEDLINSRNKKDANALLPLINDPSLLCGYASNFNIRLPKDKEEILKQNPKDAYFYAKYIIKDRWPEAEPYIMKSPEDASYYASDIIQDRWLEAEPYIMKNPSGAFMYARDIIKDRWLEAEPYIMKNPSWAFVYTIDIIKNRWPEAEPYIMKDPFWWNDYKKRFNIKEEEK